MNEAEELFKNIRYIRREIYILERKQANIRESMLPSGIRYDKDQVQTSPEDPMLKFAERISEAEELRQKRIAKLREDSALAQRILNDMPTAKYRMLLELRYIEGGIDYRYSWSEIAFEMNYVEDYVRKELYQEAIAEAQKIYDELKTPVSPL